jgi:hypothetical protein
VAVLRLVDYACKDTISTLKVLLSLALKGRLRGIMVSFRMDDGTEDSIFTGIYKAHPATAVSASLKVSMMQMRANGELD